MITLISIELYKIFKKWRTYIGFMAIGVLIPLIQLSYHLQGNRRIENLAGDLAESFIVSGNLMNGYLIAYTVMFALYIHIPFLIVLVGGDLLAGEATAGTYRMLLTRPISRFKIITSKFLAGTIYTVLLVCWLILLSLVVSVLLFGSGELLVFGSKLTIFAADDVLWRFAYAYLYAILSMVTVMSLSFLFSSLVENAIGPIITTMAVIIVFSILSNLNIDFFTAIRPYLFTTYIGGWSEFFSYNIDYSKITTSVLVLGGHITAIYIATTALFIKKDILN